MPTYDYVCKACGHRFDTFQHMSDAVLTLCPECNTEALQRLIGAGAGLVFKGSGFYLTDYKKTNGSPAVHAPSNGSSTGATSSSDTSSTGTTSSGDSAK